MYFLFYFNINLHCIFINNIFSPSINGMFHWYFFALLHVHFFISKKEKIILSLKINFHFFNVFNATKFIFLIYFGVFYLFALVF